MERGYVKLWRKLSDSQVIRDAAAWQVFTWFLLLASRQETVRWGAVLQPGELIAGWQLATHSLDMPKTTYYRVVKRLERMEMIKVRRVVGLNSPVVRICNWSTYQLSGSSGGTSGGTSSGTDAEPAVGMARESSGNEVGTVQEGKEIREGKEERECAPPHGCQDILDSLGCSESVRDAWSRYVDARYLRDPRFASLQLWAAVQRTDGWSDAEIIDAINYRVEEGSSRPLVRKPPVINGKEEIEWVKLSECDDD